MKLKKLYEANKWWNDWKFQLNWHKLEWVDPKYNLKRVKPFYVYSIVFYISRSYRTAHFFGESRLKELDIKDFFKKTDE